MFEENDYVIEDELVRLAGRNHLPYTVHGKLDRTTLDRGENSTEDALERIGRFLQIDLGAWRGQRPARRPLRCSGFAFVRSAAAV